MCGITGGVWSSPHDVPSAATRARMLDVLAHRGPDEHGQYDFRPESGPRAWLGHRRLSIIDLASGRQPLSNEGGSVWIAFNGEVYNYRELAETLKSKGHRFQTETDTEAIVHAYEEYGTDCVTHLRGMFAFAIWDEKRQRLFLARDRMGQKPLVYRVEDDRIVFASELKSLLQLPDAPKTLDPRALDEYLTYLYVPEDRCILEGYQKLGPGQSATYERGRLTISDYWQAPYQEPVREQSVDDYKQELRETLTEAVRLRMRSDVPLGTFLSGGLDSTLITGLAQSLVEQQVETFSIGFSEKKFDERTFARLASEHLRTKHHEQVVDPSAADVLSDLVYHYDEPFADSSAIPTTALSKMTREHVTVALSGDGGDELFGGYRRYEAVKLAAKLDRLPKPIRALLGSSLWQKLPASSHPKTFRRRLKRFLAAFRLSPEERYLSWISFQTLEQRSTLYADSFRERLGDADPRRWILDTYTRLPGDDLLRRTMGVDVHTYLPCDILKKVDIASMTASLECRSPFMDHKVVELAARMPTDLKIRDGRGKWILGETFPELLPEQIVKREKMGFGVPLDSWFRGDLRERLTDTLLGSRFLDRGLFRRESVSLLIDEHLSGRHDWSYRLWMLMVFDAWAERWGV